jgi:hypothetical protein
MKEPRHTNVTQTKRLTTFPDVLFIRLKRDRGGASTGMLKPFVPFMESLMADGTPYRLITVVAHNANVDDHFVAYCWAGLGADSTSAESSRPWMKFDDVGVTRDFDFHSCTHHDSGVLVSKGVDNDRVRCKEAVNSVLAEILVYQRQ